MDANDVMQRIQECSFRDLGPRPSLLFDRDRIEVIRRRALQDDALRGRVQERCDELLKKPPEQVAVELPNVASIEALVMAEGFVALGNHEYADWAKRRMMTLFDCETWLAPYLGGPHGPDSHCHHTMTNVAASLAYTRDLLGDLCTEAEAAHMAERLHWNCAMSFLVSTRTRAAWWAWEDWRTNWKIMCCGEMGFAACAFPNAWPEWRELLALCARGVIETLDVVPPEGDWYEGIHYWFTTLFMGLRFASALRRLTGGEINLFDHPALSVTGDYAALLTTPGGREFNFNDNTDRLNNHGGYAALCLLLLATETGRSDWLWAARKAPVDSALWLALDDPKVTAEPPEQTTAHFPDTGVAMIRSGWQDDDTFVGFKSSTSYASHIHLDANSFIVESRGVPLLIDEGTLPYAHLIGFHVNEDLRWNWDRAATIGHNTILIDGQGQTWGEGHDGKITKVEEADGHRIVVGDASLCYPGLLKKFIRTVVLLGSDLLVIRDVLECDGERHAEWLMHPAGSVTTEGEITVVENEGVNMTVTPLLPDRSFGWRVSDVTRTGIYPESSQGKIVTVPIRYRSFSPFRAAESFEFLFGLHIGGDPAKSIWQWEAKEGGWRLRVRDIVITPKNDSVAVSRPARSSDS